MSNTGHVLGNAVYLLVMCCHRDLMESRRGMSRVRLLNLVGRSKILLVTVSHTARSGTVQLEDLSKTKMMGPSPAQMTGGRVHH